MSTSTVLLRLPLLPGGSQEQTIITTEQGIDRVNKGISVAHRTDLWPQLEQRRSSDTSSPPPAAKRICLTPHTADCVDWPLPLVTSNNSVGIRTISVVGPSLSSLLPSLLSWPLSSSSPSVSTMHAETDYNLAKSNYFDDNIHKHRHDRSMPEEGPMLARLCIHMHFSAKGGSSPDRSSLPTESGMIETNDADLLSRLICSSNVELLVFANDVLALSFKPPLLSSLPTPSSSSLSSVDFTNGVILPLTTMDQTTDLYWTAIHHLLSHNSISVRALIQPYTPPSCTPYETDQESRSSCSIIHVDIFQKQRLGSSLCHAMKSDQLHFCYLFDYFYPSELGAAPLNLLGAVLPEVEPSSDIAQPDLLKSFLFGFQKQSLVWMLDRENDTGFFVDQEILPVFWESVLPDFAASPLFIDRFSGLYSLSKDDVFRNARENTQPLLGGLLADEMGLGKTVVIIALILAHRLSSTSTPSIHDATSQAHLKALRLCTATLVVAPSAIIEQWANELHIHSPDLRVCLFGRETDPQLFDECDVVLVTGDMLRREFYAATPESDRSRRQERLHARRRSCIVERLWWRVVVDEAQMVESSKSNLAVVARLIPRIHPWAVTGTPTSKTGLLADMHGLFCFLGIESWIAASQLKTQNTLGSSPNSSRLVTHHPNLVRRNLRRIMHRSSKESVSCELVLPLQHQHTIIVCFDRVHQLYYDEVEEKCVKLSSSCENKTAAKASKDKLEWKEADLSLTMLQLRQICCHPHIGTHNRRRLGGNVYTMDQVLSVMTRQCISSIYSMQHKRISTSVELSHMLEYKGKFKSALDKYMVCLGETRDIIAGIRLSLTQLVDNNKQNSVDVDKSSSDVLMAGTDGDIDTDLILDGDESHTSADPDSAIPLDDELSQVRTRLNFWIELEHRLLYFIATSYYLIGKRIDDIAKEAHAAHSLRNCEDGVKLSISDRDEESGFARIDCQTNEDMWYKRAEQLRRMTLYDYELRTTRIIQKVLPNLEALPREIYKKSNPLRKTGGKGRDIGGNSSSFTNHSDDSMMIVLPAEFFGGIITSNVFSEISDVVDSLNAQWKILVEWREKVIHLLTLPLENSESVIDSSAKHSLENGKGRVSAVSSLIDPFRSSSEAITRADAPTGEEYGIGLEIQEKANQYQYAYMQIISDRLTLLTSMRRDVDRRYYGTTQLQHELYKKRVSTVLKNKQLSFAELIRQLKDISQRSDVPAQEIYIASNAHREMTKHLNVHLECLELLQSETKRLAHLGNARIVYFRELQKFHEGVTFPKKPTSLDLYSESLCETIQELGDQITVQVGRRRYFKTLESDHSEHRVRGENIRECAVCHSMFQKGVVTPCGHMFCDGCNTGWIMSRARCPMCNQKIQREAIVKVTLRDIDKDVHIKGNIISITTSHNATTNQSKSISQLDIPHLAEKLSAIKVNSTFGAKFDTIVRHVKHLMATQARVKVILFSQWEQVLEILSRAFQDNGIGFVKMEGSGWTPHDGKLVLKRSGQSVVDFNNREDLVVFMLNAKSQSSGLTLVCATHIILIEPLLNRSIEQQAINRVHRIGQKQETHVWRYIVRGTVEERIAALADQRAPMADQSVLPIRFKLSTKQHGGGEVINEADIHDILRSSEVGMGMSVMP
ncbi:hypothetical protein BASA84_000168 [Batrachochytrium salamandrivorans]|nr:hypothetical protein BASA84_000168 [Batrachochytrium salamandrivorans]